MIEFLIPTLYQYLNLWYLAWINQTINIQNNICLIYQKDSMITFFLKYLFI